MTSPTAAVFGSARLREGEREYAEARELGGLLAEAGWTVATGGYDGAMAAVSRGAHERGGRVVGVTMAPWGRRRQPNRWIHTHRPAPDLHERIRGLVAADAWLAVSGGPGTLAEVAVAWNLMIIGESPPRPLILIGERWAAVWSALSTRLIVDPVHRELVRHVPSPIDAMAVLGSASGAR